MSLAMTPVEREAFLAEVHVAVVTVADDDGRGPLAIPLWYTMQVIRGVVPPPPAAASLASARSALAGQAEQFCPRRR